MEIVTQSWPLAAMSGLRVIRNLVDQDPLVDDSAFEKQPVDSDPGELRFSARTGSSKLAGHFGLPVLIVSLEYGVKSHLLVAFQRSMFHFSEYVFKHVTGSKEVRATL